MTPDEIRRARLELGLSQDQLADAAGVGQSTISKAERGQLGRQRDRLPLIVSALERLLRG